MSHNFVIIKYHPGKEMTLTDALSYYLPLTNADIALYIAIQLSDICNFAFQCTVQGNLLVRIMSKLILDGCSESIHDVPCTLCAYWVHHFTIEYCITLHGNILLILHVEMEEALTSTGEAHQGITKYQLHESSTKLYLFRVPLLFLFCPSMAAALPLLHHQTIYEASYIKHIRGRRVN